MSQGVVSEGPAPARSERAFENQTNQRTWIVYKLLRNPRKQYLFHCNILCDRSFSAQPISIRKAQWRKKAHKPLHTSWISQNKTVSAMFDNHTSVLPLWLQDTQTSHIFSWFCLRFALCSLGLYGATCAKDHGPFYLNDPEMNEVEKCDSMVGISKEVSRSHTSLPF